MSDNLLKKPLSIALGAAFVGSITGASVADAAENPFGMKELSSGYMIADAAEGKYGGKMKGESRCAGMMKKMDADGDGRITREEFMAGHEAIFNAKDKNGDGVIDADEIKAMREGKCGEAKCGSNKK